MRKLDLTTHIRRPRKEKTRGGTHLHVGLSRSDANTRFRRWNISPVKFHISNVADKMYKHGIDHTPCNSTRYFGSARLNLIACSISIE
jgi:hypothetical protein